MKKNHSDKTVFRSAFTMRKGVRAARGRKFWAVDGGGDDGYIRTYGKGRSGPDRGRRACSCGTVACQSVGRIVGALQHIHILCIYIIYIAILYYSSEW